ncbi:MAG: KilA-N domain-containing protein [Bacteroides fragilis]|nr:KilA-N domain-containing protein [Bacteroides fragilis]
MPDERRRRTGRLNIDGTEVQVLQIEEDDYISLTDMVMKIDNGPALIEKWLRNKSTIELPGIWEISMQR